MTNTRPLFFMFFVALIFLQAAEAAQPTNSAIRRAFPTDFSYGFNHPHALRTIGTLSIKGERYLIVYYNYEETRKQAAVRGGVPHAAHRLTVFRNDRGLKYLGFYGVEKSAIGIAGKTIRFDYDATLGNSITFTDYGPPRHIRLDGELGEFGT